MHAPICLRSLPRPVGEHAASLSIKIIATSTSQAKTIGVFSAAEHAHTIQQGGYWRKIRWVPAAPGLFVGRGGVRRRVAQKAVISRRANSALQRPEQRQPSQLLLQRHRIVHYRQQHQPQMALRRAQLDTSALERLPPSWPVLLIRSLAGRQCGYKHMLDLKL